MPRLALLAYLLLPALVALSALAFALSYEPLTLEMLLIHLVGGFLFYAAPHLLWLVASALFSFSAITRHAGLVAASLTLGVVGISSLVEHDRSGLPMQWLLYWPLALVLQTLSAGVGAAFVRSRRSSGA